MKNILKKIGEFFKTRIRKEVERLDDYKGLLVSEITDNVPEISEESATKIVEVLIKKIKDVVL